MVGTNLLVEVTYLLTSLFDWPYFLFDITFWLSSLFDWPYFLFDITFWLSLLFWLTLLFVWHYFLLDITFWLTLLLVWHYFWHEGPATRDFGQILSFEMRSSRLHNCRKHSLFCHISRLSLFLYLKKGRDELELI